MGKNTYIGGSTIIKVCTRAERRNPKRQILVSKNDKEKLRKIEERKHTKQKILTLLESLLKRAERAEEKKINEVVSTIPNQALRDKCRNIMEKCFIINDLNYIKQSISDGIITYNPENDIVDNIVKILNTENKDLILEALLKEAVKSLNNYNNRPSPSDFANKTITILLGILDKEVKQEIADLKHHFDEGYKIEHRSLKKMQKRRKKKKLKR